MRARILRANVINEKRNETIIILEKQRYEYLNHSDNDDFPPHRQYR